MSRLPIPRSIVWATAFFGVFVGHAIAYAILAPIPQARSQLLASTGHGYLPVAVHAALASALIGFAAAFLGRLTRGRGNHEMAFRGLAARVVSFQILTFAAIEVAERVAARAPLHDLTDVLPVGAVAQLAVGLLVAAAISLILRAADAAAEILGSPAPATARASSLLLALPGGVPAFTDRLVLRGRGPPR
ncbi:MAG TPA: hypothetical protein VFB09_08155 [Actinomycetota bacterium]|nr:hypothetical protein [Actinomycetota bacterium]